VIALSAPLSGRGHDAPRHSIDLASTMTDDASRHIGQAVAAVNHLAPDRVLNH
jgi:hypothetical protein